MSDKHNDPGAAPNSHPWYKRRKPRRNAIIISTLLVVLTLLYSFAPTYIARLIIDSRLYKYGIQHSGVETLRINPWTMEVWLGPVEFWSGDIEHGQLGELGIKLNLLPVFQKHAMVERILVRGIDIYVVRAEDNTINLNGIPLEQFFPAKDTSVFKQVEEDASPWGAGLGIFELQDSRLIFKEKTGGSLTVQLENIRLNDFMSWSPDLAGSYELKANINDIEFNWKGEARPFAEHITLTADAVTRQAELPKIIEYTGPLGKNPLERRGGVYNSEFQHELILFKTGRLEGKTVGKMEVLGVDYLQDESFALAVERAEMDIDTAYTISEKNDININGQIIVEMLNTTGKLPKNSVFDLEKAHIELTELNTVLKDDRSLSVAVKPQVNLANGHFTGQIQLSIDSLTDILRQLQSLSAANVVSKEQTGLGDFAGDEVTLPRSTITISHLQTNSPKLELTTSAGSVSLDHSVNVKVNGLEIASEKRRMTTAMAKTEISGLQLHSGEGKMSLRLSGHTVLTNIREKGPFGEVKIDSVETENEKLALQIESGNIAIENNIKAMVKGSQLRMYKLDELPETSIGIGAVSTNLKKGRFAVENQKMIWQGNADASVDNLTINVAKGKKASTKFQRLELRNANVDQKLNISADAFTLSGLDVFVTRQYIDNILATAKQETTPQQQEEIAKTSQDSVKSRSVETNKPVLQLGRVALLKGANIRFEDENVQPAIKINTIFKTVELRDVNMKDPDKRANVELLATINEFTNIELNGWATHLGPSANLEIKGKIENLELPPYSPYMAEFGGVNIESGRFSTDTDVKAELGSLAGIINLDVQHLNFTPLSEEDAKRLSEKAGFPIQTAVGLLQDSGGRISLKFPVSGTVVEPDVDISSAITKAIGGTLKAIFPPTMIAGMLSSQSAGGGLTFEPIKFKAGSAEMDATARKYADELVTLLQERPILSLYVCGESNAEDFFELTLININKPTKTAAAAEQRVKLIETHKPKLLELAKERTQVVRHYMITEKGQDAKRIGECRPNFDVDDTGPPRVNVTL